MDDRELVQRARRAVDRAGRREVGNRTAGRRDPDAVWELGVSARRRQWVGRAPAAVAVMALVAVAVVRGGGDGDAEAGRVDLDPGALTADFIACRVDEPMDGSIADGDIPVLVDGRQPYDPATDGDFVATEHHLTAEQVQAWWSSWYDSYWDVLDFAWHHDDFSMDELIEAYVGGTIDEDAAGDDEGDGEEPDAASGPAVAGDIAFAQGILQSAWFGSNPDYADARDMSVELHNFAGLPGSGDARFASFDSHTEGVQAHRDFLEGYVDRGVESWNEVGDRWAAGYSGPGYWDLLAPIYADMVAHAEGSAAGDTEEDPAPEEGEGDSGDNEEDTADDAEGEPEADAGDEEVEDGADDASEGDTAGAGDEESTDEVGDEAGEDDGCAEGSVEDEPVDEGDEPSVEDDPEAADDGEEASGEDDAEAADNGDEQVDEGPAEEAEGEDDREPTDGGEEPVEEVTIERTAESSDGWERSDRSGPAELEGPAWLVTGLVDGETVTPVDPEADATLTFTGSDIEMEVCNTGTSPVAEVADGELDVGPVTRTMMACGSPKDDVEEAVVEVLHGRIAYGVAGDMLILSHPDGQGLLLTAQE